MLDKQNAPNNSVILKGRVASVPEFSHSLYGENYMNMHVSVAGLSGTTDILPVTVAASLLELFPLREGDDVAILGQLRSYNRIVQEKCRLIIVVFAQHLAAPDDVQSNPNTVELEGFLCREPVYRTTPFGREITDMLIAVNRQYGKSDYIPAIAWGRNARATGAMCVGSRLRLVGRLQSREYQKRLPDGSVDIRTAYEVSISQVELVQSECDTIE